MLSSTNRVCGTATGERRTHFFFRRTSTPSPRYSAKSWRPWDPLERMRSHLLRAVPESELEQMRRRIDAELEQAIDLALAEPPPDPESAGEGTYRAWDPSWSVPAAVPPWTASVMFSACAGDAKSDATSRTRTRCLGMDPPTAVDGRRDSRRGGSAGSRIAA